MAYFIRLQNMFPASRSDIRLILNTDQISSIAPIEGGCVITMSVAWTDGYGSGPIQHTVFDSLESVLDQIPGEMRAKEAIFIGQPIPALHLPEEGEMPTITNGETAELPF